MDRPLVQKKILIRPLIQGQVSDYVVDSRIKVHVLDGALFSVKPSQ